MAEMNGSGVSMSDRDIMTSLHGAGGFKLGCYRLKSGAESPIYVDLRVLVSYPHLLKAVSEAIWRKIKESGIEFDLICGVPYTALPIATCISVAHNIPMVMRRKEAKNYGTNRMIEGHFEPGQRALIIEDVISSGSSIMETALVLKRHGLKISDAVLLVERQQSGSELMAKYGVRIHSVYTLEAALNHLTDAGLFESAKAAHALKWVKDNPARMEEKLIEQLDAELGPNANFKDSSGEVKVKDGQGIVLGPVRQTYASRAKECKDNVLTKLIFELMQKKKTNLCLAVDLTCGEEILKQADLAGPHIVLLKTHIDIVTDFSKDFINRLEDLAKKHEFYIFEDRKFADIGNTVSLQYHHGVFNISQWAHLTNAHITPGPDVVSALKKNYQSGLDKEKQPRGCLLVAEMSSKGNLTSKGYAVNAATYAEMHKDFVVGFISQSRITNRADVLHCTPGVRLDAATRGMDDMGQQYVTVEEAILTREADVVIVGRGISQALDVQKAAADHQAAGWAAYLKVTGQFH